MKSQIRDNILQFTFYQFQDKIKKQKKNYFHETRHFQVSPDKNFE